MGHTKQHSHVWKLEKSVELITQSQNPTFLLGQKGENRSFEGAIVGIRGLRTYVGPWALSEDILRTEDR